jgi:hypothetical protein
MPATLCGRCAAALRGLWAAAPPQPCSATQVLLLPLRPSPRWRAALRLLRWLAVAHAVELLLTRHWLPALLVAMLAAFCLTGGRSPRGRYLRLEPGRMCLVHPGGVLEEVRLGSGSMRLGAHLLLVLHGGNGIDRLLLGPDNLAPGELAALNRRLPGGMASTTALHSAAATGSKSSQP